MSEAPKKIWVDFVDWPDSPPLICSIKPDVHSWNGEPYIRADLVEELVEALLAAKSFPGSGYADKASDDILDKLEDGVFPDIGKKAYLISAAPELYDELEKLISGADAMGWEITKAKATLAKALGEP